MSDEIEKLRQRAAEARQRANEAIAHAADARRHADEAMAAYRRGRIAVWVAAGACVASMVSLIIAAVTR